jgi:hypothetical protein
MDVSFIFKIKTFPKDSPLLLKSGQNAEQNLSIYGLKLAEKYNKIHPHITGCLRVKFPAQDLQGSEENIIGMVTMQPDCGHNIRVIS